MSSDLDQQLRMVVGRRQTIHSYPTPAEANKCFACEWRSARARSAASAFDRRVSSRIDAQLIMRRLILAVTILCASIRVYGGSFDHEAWNELLVRHVIPVRQGYATQVDYSNFAADRAKLKTYLASTSAVSRETFEAWTSAEQMAFLLNAYNAWTIELVLTRYPRLESIKDLGSLVRSPWKKRFIPLLGERLSLDEIEREWLRSSDRYRDPRVYFAVNCASVGCPALAPEAYVAENLEQQLERAVERFLSDRERNRVESGRLRVSSVFKWHRNDFERGWRGYLSLRQFLADHAGALGLTGEEISRLRAGLLIIEFLDDDWRLNDTSGKRTRL